jgi:hypothetical protein
MVSQEAGLILGTPFPWPQAVLNFWKWASALLSFNFALTGPECSGDFDYAGRWAINVLVPAFLLLLHIPVFIIRSVLARSNHKKRRLRSQFIGSLLFWLKMLPFTMLNLALDNLACSEQTSNAAPAMAGNSTNATTTSKTQTWTLDADPSVTCSTNNVKWIGLVLGSCFIMVMFQICLPIVQFWVIYDGKMQKPSKLSESANDDKPTIFQVKYASMYAAFEANYW